MPSPVGTRRTLALLAALAVGPIPLAGQETSEALAGGRAQEGSGDAPDRGAARIQAAQARLDSLMPLFERARERALEVEEARRRAEQLRVIAGTDTIQVGPFRVVVFEGEGTEARAHFHRAWDHYGPLLGGAAPERLNGHLFGFQHALEFRPMPLPSGATDIRERAWRTDAAVEGAVRHAVGALLTALLPGPQRDWIGNAPLGSRPPWGRIYRELVMTSSRVSERCRLGDLAGCWSAMGAIPMDDPWAEIRGWYSEAERRQRVASSTPFRSVSWADCVGGDTTACDLYLTSARGRAIPLPTTARASLAMFALEMGGEGSLARFSEARAEPVDFRDLIARTAGVEPDRVMAEWRRRVMDARPENAGPDEYTRLVTLLWVLLFAGLSTRSTRWRSS